MIGCQTAAKPNLLFECMRRKFCRFDSVCAASALSLPRRCCAFTLIALPRAAVPSHMDGEPKNRGNDCLRQIEAMQVVHQQQRMRLEAELESNPSFHAGYSQHLVRLMQREEDLLAQGGEAETLGRRVEEMLASETTKLFKLRGQQCEERWRTLFERQSQYREKLTRQIREQMKNTHANEGPPGLAPKPEGVAALEHEHHACLPSERQPQRQPQARGRGEFEVREAKMRAASAERWAEDELFNLQNAFDLQLKRLEVDWAAHDVKVGVEYDARRAMLQARAGIDITSGAELGQAGGRVNIRGVSPSSLGKSGGGASEGGCGETPSSPWRSREKQSRLIHTAPVFQPSSGRMGGGLGGTGGGSAARRSSRYWAEKELERLDEAFLSVAGQVREQKQAAQRWIRRQKIRMEAQAKAMGEERGRRQQRLAAVEREEAQLMATVLVGGR